MKVVVQRVHSASVTVAKESIASIDHGLLLLIGIHPFDDQKTIDWMVKRIYTLRCFPGDSPMDLSIQETGGEILAVSQFTLYGDCKKGRRPSFVSAAHPSIARPLFEQFINEFQTLAPGKVQSGRFGADMDISLVNHGPVTLIIEKNV